VSVDLSFQWEFENIIIQTAKLVLKPYKPYISRFFMYLGKSSTRLYYTFLCILTNVQDSQMYKIDNGSINTEYFVPNIQIITWHTKTACHMALFSLVLCAWHFSAVNHRQPINDQGNPNIISSKIVCTIHSVAGINCNYW